MIRFDLPPPVTTPNIYERSVIAVRTWLNRGDLPLYRELGDSGLGYQEVADALKNHKRSMVRVNARGEVIVSVAVPVLRSRTIHGALMLSTQGDDIDQMVTAERLAILKVGGVATAVMIVLSLLLASTIAGPVRRLAEFRRARPPPHPDPRRDSRFHAAPRRDRTSFRRAARHDGCAL